MSAMASQITSFTIVYSSVYSGADKIKTSKLRDIGLCAGNSPVTGEFPAQKASDAENASIWWRHHVLAIFRGIYTWPHKEPQLCSILWLSLQLTIYRMDSISLKYTNYQRCLSHIFYIWLCYQTHSELMFNSSSNANLYNIRLNKYLPFINAFCLITVLVLT